MLVFFSVLSFTFTCWCLSSVKDVFILLLAMQIMVAHRCISDRDMSLKLAPPPPNHRLSFPLPFLFPGKPGVYTGAISQCGNIRRMPITAAGRLSLSPKLWFFLLCADCNPSFIDGRSTAVAWLSITGTITCQPASSCPSNFLCRARRVIGKPYKQPGMAWEYSPARA